MTDLKPCPNPECCAEHEPPWLESWIEDWFVHCECGCRGPDCETEAEAARLWNLLPRIDDERIQTSEEELEVWLSD